MSHCNQENAKYQHIKTKTSFNHSLVNETK